MIEHMLTTLVMLTMIHNLKRSSAISVWQIIGKHTEASAKYYSDNISNEFARNKYMIVFRINYGWNVSHIGYLATRRR